MPHRRHALVLSLALLWSLGLTSALAQSPMPTTPTSPAHEHEDEAHDAHDDHADEHAEHDDHDHADEHAEHDDHDHADDHADAHADHGHGAGIAGTRLLVAEADGPRLVVLDLATGTELARFGTPGPGTVHPLPDGQVAVVLHRDTDRVTVVHSGLTVVDHGDHADLVEGLPYVVQTVNLGPAPSGIFARGADLAIYHDGDGSVAWLDRRLLGVSLDYAFIAGRAPGAGAVAVVDGLAYVGSHDLGRVDAVDAEGRTVASFDGCPELRAPAAWAGGVAFGCADGVLLVARDADGAVTAHYLANPEAAPAGARVAGIVGDGASPTLVGGFGEGLVRIDPVARALTWFALPAAPLAMGFADGGAVLVVLTADGALHALDPNTGAVQRSVAVVDAVVAGAVRPSLAIVGEHVYVADPTHDVVVEVYVDAFEVERRLALPFTPGGLAGLAIEGAATH
jgi:DNA-binding beta-propeller fold protein YncE